MESLAGIENAINICYGATDSKQYATVNPYRAQNVIALVHQPGVHG